METEHLLENAIKKREQKHCDLLIANSLKQQGAGFQGDTNIVTIVDEAGAKELPMMSKQEVARHIWLRILSLMAKKGDHAC